MRPFIFVIVIAMLCSCASQQKNEADSPAKDTVITADDIPAIEIKDTRLYDDNIEEHLLAYAEEHPETKVKIITQYGDIHLKLYENTPLHRANFIELIKKGIYENTMFSRVVKGFVIQGGSSNQESAMNKKFYHGSYTLPHEMDKGHIHKYGALAMSRQYTSNPNKRSDAFDFYIVIGEKMYPRTLYNIQEEKGIRYSEEQLNLYKSIGGTPHLDQEHTVFGEVTKGMDIVKKINNLEVDGRDWPKEDVIINFEIIR